MSNILILPISAADPDPNEYAPIRQTRNNKYFRRTTADPNAMDIQQVVNADDDMLAAFEAAFANMDIKGGKRKTKRSKRVKTRKSRKSRKSRKN